MSTGHVETVIGIIECLGQPKGCHLQLSAVNHSLDIPSHRTMLKKNREKLEDIHVESEEEEVVECGEPWLAHGSSPILTLMNDTSGSCSRTFQ